MIETMISSTITDLLSDRTSVQSALQSLQIVNLIGAKPIAQPPLAMSPYLATIEMAETCHLLVLILGGRYGEEVRPGKSATELEFDAAYGVDPTKVIVFKKRVEETDSKQQAFIKKVSDYFKGYWITSYTSTDELEPLVIAAFMSWLKDRAAIGRRIDFFDHFLRLVVQRTPAPGVRPAYSVQDDVIALTYSYFGNHRSIEFSKEKIYSDFWGCIAEVDAAFERWRG